MYEAILAIYFNHILSVSEQVVVGILVISAYSNNFTVRVWLTREAGMSLKVSVEQLCSMHSLAL